MFDKFYVGLDLTSSEDNGKLKPISRVTLLVDNDNAYTAGDDTGRELVADCAHATQAMVDSILAQIKGYQYRAYSADDANIDPAAELGDAVTADGMYSVIARMDDDGSGYIGLSAPGEAEMEDEYPSAGPMTQEFDRKLAETYSLITKTAEQIRMEVANEVDGLSASIDIQLESITAEVDGLDGRTASLELGLDGISAQVTDNTNSVAALEMYVDSLTLSVSNGSTSSTIKLMAGGAEIASQTINMTGLVTYTGLSSGTTTIDGACIKTGTIDAERINLSGAITWNDLSSGVQGNINSAYSLASTANGTANSASADASDALSTANALANGTGGGTFINGTTVNSPRIVGGLVTGAVISFGVDGAAGKLHYTTGSDGVSTTNLIQLSSSAGIVLNASTNMRFEANSLWINIDVASIYVKKSGSWASLSSLLS